MGALLYPEGKPDEARSCFERALEIRQAVLGAAHPDTAMSMEWIGTLLARSGDTDGAHAHLQRAVAIFTRALGVAHPRTQECQRALAALDEPPKA
jgi:Tfp pilus assembly protein PilF